MPTPVEAECRRSRRAFLGHTGGVLGSVTAARLEIGSVAAAPTPTVLTWNVYLGVDLGRLFGVESLADVRAIAGEMLDRVDPATYEARADAIAAEIEATAPDVVALQEATLLRTQQPGDFGAEDPTAAETVVVDFLDAIASALDGRNLDYEIAATTVTTDVELPADSRDGRLDLRITDRDVLLVRGDHEAREAVADTYAASIPFPVPGTDDVLQLRRGFCSVETLVGGVPFTAVSTHLESISSRIRARQADELLEALPPAQPVVLCGDFNSGPRASSGTYERLTEAFDDAHAAVGSETDGFTCCQPADLENDQSQLHRRVDLVLHRDGVRSIDVGRVGHRAEDRTTLQRNGEEVRLWHSDHAGVVATLEIPEPTPDPQQAAPPKSTAPQSTRSGDSTTDTSTQSPTQGSGPGLGVVAAVAGTVGFGLVGLSRLLGNDE